MLLARLTRSSLPTVVRAGSCRPLWRPSYSTASITPDPLRILFCGSDNFSCASLKALHDEQQRNGDLIQSIHVLVRPSKPAGRGRRFLDQLPVQVLAHKLDLHIHVRDTFTGWNLPTTSHGPINLIIAVSIGLFVPPRILDAAAYGGLNVHPSLLPDLKGPAPIQHALLHNYTHTGVTVQTLSPSSFDSGTPLLSRGLPIPKDATFSSLHDTLAAQGAALLISTLRRGLHLPGTPVPTDDDNTPPPPALLRHAPKITPADRQIRWTTATASSVARQARALGPLWTTVPVRREAWQPREARAILDELSVVAEPAVAAVGGAAPVWEARRALLVREGEKLQKGGEEGNQEQQQQQQQQQQKGEGEEEEVEKPHQAPPRGTVTFIEKDGPDPGGVKTTLKCSTLGLGSHLDVEMPDGSVLRVGRIKMEGSTFKPAGKIAWRQAYGKPEEKKMAGAGRGS